MKKSIIFLVLSFLISFLACEQQDEINNILSSDVAEVNEDTVDNGTVNGDEGQIVDDGNDSSDINEESEFLGTRAITSNLLPICDNSKNGQLFYVLDIEEFKYCNGSSYVTIDLTDTVINEDNTVTNVTNNVDKEVYDGNDTKFGIVWEYSYYSINVYNPDTEYTYMLNWDGTIERRGFYYTEQDGLGTVYTSCFNVIYGKIVFKDIFSGKYYRPKNVDSYNNVIVSTETVMINSTSNRDGYGNLSISFELKDAVEMVETTKAECGIPENIPLPIQIR